MSQSGYQPCACPTCFEIAIGDLKRPALCLLCEEAGCDGVRECSVEESIEEDDDE